MFVFFGDNLFHTNKNLHITKMKKTIVPILFLFICLNIKAQSREYTPELEKELMTKVEKLVVNFKKTLNKDEVSWNSFKVDTFMIERYIDLRMETDYSTHGMNQTMYEAEKRYDKLLNKYYKVLLGKLQGEDKKVLIETQKSWITFKNNEIKLISTFYSDKYTGGGTMYSNIRVGSVFEITKKRAIELALYMSND